MKQILTLSCLMSLVSSQNSRNLTFVLSARDLPEKDAHTQIDPFVRIYSTFNDSNLINFGSSELIHDNDSPDWTTVFSYPWEKGTGQKWKFQILDDDYIKKDDALGGVEISVDDYVEAGENLTVLLNPQGTLAIQKTTPVTFKLSARFIPKKDRPIPIVAAFTKDQGFSDPYVKCYFRKGIGGEDIKFWTTSTINDVVETQWEEIIEFGNYQEGQDMYLRFKVKDADPISRDDDIGYVLLEVDPFIQAGIPKTLPIRTENWEQTGATLTITPILPYQLA